MINSADDIVKWILALNRYKDIKSVVTEEVDERGKINLLTSSSSVFMKNMENDKLWEALTAIELSAGYYFLTEAGIQIKGAVQKLTNKDIELILLNENLAPFTHGLKTDKFIIPFSL